MIADSWDCLIVQVDTEEQDRSDSNEQSVPDYGIAHSLSGNGVYGLWFGPRYIGQEFVSKLGHSQ
jgi:hypothetical protein